VSSGRIGFRDDNLTLEDLRALAAAGHEVGGHTLEHEDLEDLPLAEVRHQICDDRVALMRLGFPVTSFAYPFGSDTPAVRQILIDCNFNNGRVTGRIRNPTGCSSCPLAESIPPPGGHLHRVELDGRGSAESGAPGRGLGRRVDHDHPAPYLRWLRHLQPVR